MQERNEFLTNLYQILALEAKSTPSKFLGLCTLRSEIKGYT